MERATASDRVDRRAKIEARRDQVLAAAGACARQSGFHGASMAQIAKAADLSVGQIYRYFKNKEAIIAAIVAKDAARVSAIFALLEAAPGDLLTALQAQLAAQIDQCFDRDRTALKLEILAEAARNPRVAAIVQAAQACQTAQAARLLGRLRQPGWTQIDLEIRAEMLGVIFDGVQTRAVQRPQLDRAVLVARLKVIISHIVT